MSRRIVRTIFGTAAAGAVTYGGIGGTLFGTWTTAEETDSTSAGVTVMYPGTLSSSGASFNTYLHAVP